MHARSWRLGSEQGKSIDFIEASGAGGLFSNRDTTYADSADLRPLIGEPVLSKGTNEAAQNMRRRPFTGSASEFEPVAWNEEGPLPNNLNRYA
jgi:hypothetical protein